MNLKYRIAILAFIGLLILSMYPIALSGPSEGEVISLGAGKEISISALPEDGVIVPQDGHVPPLGYEIDPELLEELKNTPSIASDEVPATQDLSVTSEETDPLAPTLHGNFEGLDDYNQPDGYMHRPPDPIIAAGLNHIMVMVNSEFAIYSKSGALLAETSFISWWSNVYNGSELPFDPRIVYDHHQNRWIMIALVRQAEPNSWYLLSVSQGSNPLGGWWNWRISAGLSYGGSNTWGDYPDIGFDGIPSGSGGCIYITTNQFTWTNSFKTVMLNVIQKAILYVGGGGSYWRGGGHLNSDGSMAFTMRTALTYGNPGAEYLINSKSGGWDKVTVWKVVPGPNPGNAPTITKTTVTIGSYSPPPNAKQLGGSGLLDTIDNRIYNCIYRNGHVYAAFTEEYNWGTPANMEAAIRVLKINVVTNAPDYNVRYGADNYYYWFPAITTDMDDNMVVVFARSGASEYAGIRYTGKKTTDASLQSSALLKAGATYIAGTGVPEVNRWGDYFGAARDPANPDKVWIYGEWAKDTPYSSLWDWGTWIGKVSFWSVGHQPTYHFRMSPYTDIIHVHLDGTLIHGTDNYDGGGGYHKGGYHNAPVLGTYKGDYFYFFLDWLKYDDGTETGYQMGMIIGRISTQKGSLYRTMDGMSWIGPTSITLVNTVPTEPITAEATPMSAIEIEPNGGVWPPTYHFQTSPFVDIMHVGVSGAIINGVQDATSYSNQPVLGTALGNNFYMATDFTKDNNGDPIFYELSLLIGLISTQKGNLYRTQDGMSWVGPTAVTLITQ